MTTIVFLGAGSVVFTRQLLTDILGFPELTGARLVLHDIDPDRLATARAHAERIADARGARPAIVATLDRRAALDGADFVINAIAVGGYPATRTDFDVPARFGLRQTIGDTIGVGGIFRGLRTFPVLAGIAADMAELCPDAWLLNYTNPMAMNVTYLSQVAPALKVLGLCHSVYWTVRGLCDLVKVPFEEVEFDSAGVNHQAWILRWQLHGETSIRPWTPRSPPTGNCAAASGSTCTAGSASTRPRPASTPPSTCPGICIPTGRSNDCASRWGSTCGSWPRAAPTRWTTTAPSTPRRSSTAW